MIELPDIGKTQRGSSVLWLGVTIVLLLGVIVTGGAFYLLDQRAADRKQDCITRLLAGPWVAFAVRLDNPTDPRAGEISSARLREAIHKLNRIDDHCP